MASFFPIDLDNTYHFRNFTDLEIAVFLVVVSKTFFIFIFLFDIRTC